MPFFTGRLQVLTFDLFIGTLKYETKNPDKRQGSFFDE